MGSICMFTNLSILSANLILSYVGNVRKPCMLCFRCFILVVKGTYDLLAKGEPISHQPEPPSTKGRRLCSKYSFLNELPVQGPKVLCSIS